MKFEGLLYELSTFSVFDIEDHNLIEYEGNIAGRGFQYQALEVESFVITVLNE